MALPTKGAIAGCKGGGEGPWAPPGGGLGGVGGGHLSELFWDQIWHRPGRCVLGWAGAE